MARTRILLDSNSYFRLAQNLHPLLFNEFGEEKFTLFVHADLNWEFKRSSRLRSKFDWVMDEEFVENRKRSLRIKKDEKEPIEMTHAYIWEHVREGNLGPSDIDVQILATAAVLEIMVVTDDADMIAVADMYGIHWISSLELIKMMLDHDHITMENVSRVVDQWRYDKDLPNKHFEKDFERIFGSPE